MPEVVTITLRLPDDLHAELVQDAKDENRSLNGQIVHLLRRARRDPALTARALADPPPQD